MPVYWRRGGSATFDLLLQNSPITKQKSIGLFIVTLMNSPITKQKGIGSFIVTLMNSPITKQKNIGSFIVTLMNSPITKRCFVILNIVKNLSPLASHIVMPMRSEPMCSPAGA